MAASIRQAIRRVLPGAGRIGEAWRRAEERRLGGRLKAIQAGWLASHGAVVQSGPFRGMAYLSDSVGSALMPKLLGSYEQELHPVLERLAGRDYRTLIDVGCAEGYYAVGLARVFPRADVYAYDVDAEGRRLCAELARLNGVSDRVHVREFCDADALSRFPDEAALLVCDCEGCERELLRPESVPPLRGWDMLVELHDFLSPGLTPELVGRLDPTHEVTILDTQPRDPARYPALAGLPERDRWLPLDEWRGRTQQWAFFTPRAGDRPEV